jgi:putrescine transport system substrate-binding protein
MTTTAFRTGLISAGIAALLAACSHGASPPAAAPGTGAAGTAAPASASGAQGDPEHVLNVYNWSDYMDKDTIPDFETKYGIKVNYDVFDSNEVLETKLLAGHTGYDVVVPSASFLERQIKAGVFQKLDKSQLPNLKNMDPEITRRVALHDPGNAYAVNYLLGTSGVGYNETKIKALMPDAPVDSFRMFYDPAVVSKFKDCGVTLLDSPTEIVGTVLIYLGKDANSESPQDLQQVEKVLLAIRPYLRYVNSAKYIDDLANGEVCLVLGWSGDVLQARDRAREAGKGMSIKYRIPHEGAIMYFDMLAIPADASHLRNAHLFINYLMRPEVAAKNSNAVHYANGNLASLPLVAEDIKGDPSIYPSAEVRDKLVADLAKSPQYTRLLTRTWTRFKTGH